MPVQAPPLTTAYPANIGLLADEHTVILLPLTEPDGLAPSDVAGTLEDLGAADGVTPSYDEGTTWASGGTRFFGGCLAVWDLSRVYPPSGRGEQCTLLGVERDRIAIATHRDGTQDRELEPVRHR